MQEKNKQDKIKTYIAEGEAYIKSDKSDLGLLSFKKAINTEFESNNITLSIDDMSYIIHSIQSLSYTHEEWLDVISYGDLCKTLSLYEIISFEFQEHLFWRSIALSKLQLYEDAIESINDTIENWSSLWRRYFHDKDHKNNLSYSKLKKLYYEKAKIYYKTKNYTEAIHNFTTAFSLATEDEDKFKIIGYRVYVHIDNKQFSEARRDCNRLITKAHSLYQYNLDNHINFLKNGADAKNYINNILANCYLLKSITCMNEFYHINADNKKTGKKSGEYILLEILELTELTSNTTKEISTDIESQFLRFEALADMANMFKSTPALIKEGISIANKLLNYYSNVKDNIVIPKLLSKYTNKKWDAKTMHDRITMDKKILLTILKDNI